MILDDERPGERAHGGLGRVAAVLPVRAIPSTARIPITPRSPLSRRRRAPAGPARGHAR
ncbi:MAG: hypothetical protein ACLP8X_39975 [Streptosporangiaceae bacterium]